MDCKVYSLLETAEDGKVAGPFSPMHTFNSIRESIGIPFNRLARVSFENPEYNNWYEAPGKRELTGCDTLLLAGEGKTGIRVVGMVLDAGVEIIPIFIWFEGDDKVELTESYQGYKLAKKVTAEECMEIIQHAIQNKCFEIKNK